MDAQCKIQNVQKYSIGNHELAVENLTTILTKNNSVFVVGCTLDSLLFAYHCSQSKQDISLTPLGQVMLPTYPVCSYHYDSVSDTLYAGTARGDLLSFPDFENMRFKRLCKHTSSLSAEINRFVHLIWKEGDNLYTIHNQKYVIKWPRDPEQRSQQVKVFKSHVYCALHLKQIDLEKPRLAIVFKDKMAPYLLRDINQYDKLYYQIENEKRCGETFNFAQATCIAHCSRSNILATGSVDNFLNVFSIVRLADSAEYFFASLLYKVQLKERATHLVFNPFIRRPDQLQAQEGTASMLSVCTASMFILMDGVERKCHYQYQSKKVLGWTIAPVGSNTFVQSMVFDPLLDKQHSSKASPHPLKLWKITYSDLAN